MRCLGLLLLLFACVALAPLSLRPVKAQDQPLVVIVGDSFPATDISTADLRSCFRGRRVSVGGVALIPFNLPTGDPLRVAFDRAVLGLEPEQVGRFWVDARIRDQGSPPRTAPNVGLAMRVAKALKGAITYTYAGNVDPKVKVLTIDGKRPGDPGYLLAP